MRSNKLSNLLVLGFLLGIFAGNCFGQSTPGGDVVMVLPFENTSNRPEYNWVGESFADSLADLLNKPGLLVVSTDERELAYQSLRLPETVIPSRATAIKLARQARATMVVIGSYSITPVQDEKQDKGKDDQEKSPTEALVQVTARVIKVNEGRTLGEVLDGGWATRQFDFGGPLTTLQNIHGRLAYQILYQREKAFAFSQNQLVQEATKVPQRAFEPYVKGVLLSERDPRRANYLKNAFRIYADANGGAVYPQAAFELGRFYMLEGKWKDATEYFIKLQKKDPHYVEAAFYAALGYAKLGDLGHALAAIVPLSADVPLIGVYNNAGAIAVQASREEKKDAERIRLLEQGTSFLTRAAESSTDDPLVHFNYALALFLSGKYAEAADQLKPVITADPRDGQAYFLYAKSLEKTGKTDTANAADDQARRYLQSYAKWQTEWQKSQSVGGATLRMRDVLDRGDIANLTTDTGTRDAGTGEEDLLGKARDLYQAGRDEEALPELHRVVMLEPTNAEAYLLSGRINQRRGDQEAAIAALKTAIFWDPKLIDAHILLGRIFLERGDRGEAIKFATSAMNIDSNNQEAIALQRQVTMGKN
ncbi:MAG TPA: tetratricopeptide repeat protein [Pyrinomonadaceae bacterium]|jgi:tetratricopeptide (TPR) repeat protein|nr:tetratricopeptide repeat protein [Pyrinomonadaceae bacterium]